jgi:hypothetical protein
MQVWHSRWFGRLSANWLVLLLITAMGWIAAPEGAQAQSITVASGNNQAGTVGTALANPLVVRVRARGGVPIVGATVTFSVTLGNGSVAPASATTDILGNASTRLTLGTVAGTNRVVASTAGIGSVTFNATGRAGSAVSISLTPATATTRTGVAVAYSATIKDQFGNTVTNATNAVTFSTAGVTGSWSPATPVAPTSGVSRASFTGSSLGSATITAAASGLTSGTATLSVTVGTASKLVLAPASGSTQAGTGIAYTVTIQDASGNTVPNATNSITFTVGGVSGSFSPPSPVAASGGSASTTFTPITTGTGTITASATGLTSSSSTLTVTAGVRAKLSLSPVSATVQVGSALTYTALIQDTFGNTVTTATDTVSFSVAGVTGTFNPAAATASGGSATSSFTPSTSGSATVTASATGLSSATATLNVASGVGPPSKIALTPVNANTQTGTATSYQATIQDASGNTVTTATNAVTFSVSGVSGSFSPASPITPNGGIATSSFTASTSGTATITASSSGLTTGSATLTVAAVSGNGQSLFTTQTPAQPNVSDGVPYELGMKFRVARSGQITAIRYFKALSDSGTHTGRIWSSTGTQLAVVTFTGESASGWQQQALPTPLSVQANTTYVVSVNVASFFPFTEFGLATSIVNGDISSVADNNNGVFGNAFAFPSSSYHNSNYFRDVVFVANQVSVISKVSGDNQSGAGGTTLPNPLVVSVLDVNGSPQANVPITFVVTSGTGSVSPANTVTDVGGQATASLTLGSSGSTFVTATANGVGSVTFHGTVPNAVSVENQQAGTTAWNIVNYVTPANPEIMGYVSNPSINKGSNLPFMISLASPGQYRIDVYRLGNYGGTGGRLMGTFGPFAGATQSACVVTDAATRLVECPWTQSFSLTVGTNWTTGLYVANLTALASGRQSQIWFVVRDDASQSDILYQSAFMNYQAYNNFPAGNGQHYSLYDYNSTNHQRAYKVSFDRPFAAATIDPYENNNPLLYEHHLIRWLESQGYDVSYATDVDMHTSPTLPLQHRVVMVAGHDEYWSLQVRNTLEQARDSGVHLAFMSANIGYWRVRFEPSPITGVANRIMVCYKDPAVGDPVAPTYLWRGPENNRPENALLGIMYVGDDSDIYTGGYDYIVTNSNDPSYANTGFVNGSSVSRLVGYEWDAIVNNGSSPAGIITLSQSITNATTVAPNLPPGTNASISNATRYTASSGAKVFAAGSVQFSWGLDSTNISVSRESRGVKQMIVNVLSSMGASPVTPAPDIVVP